MWFPITKSHYSLQRSICKPKDIVEHCKQLGYTSCALADDGNIAGTIQFIQACKKEKIKPIVGAAVHIVDAEKKDLGKLTLLCKNIQGWKKLIQIISESNLPENYSDKKPRLPVNKLKELGSNDLVCITGGLSSTLYNSLFTNIEYALIANNYDTVKSLVRPDWETHVVDSYCDLKEVFGSVYLTQQLLNSTS